MITDNPQSDRTGKETPTDQIQDNNTSSSQEINVGSNDSTNVQEEVYNEILNPETSESKSSDSEMQQKDSAEATPTSPEIDVDSNDSTNVQKEVYNEILNPEIIESKHSDIEIQQKDSPVHSPENNSESDDESEHHDHSDHENAAHEEKERLAHLSLAEILAEMEAIVNLEDAVSHSRKFSALKEAANHKISKDNNKLKEQFVAEGNPEELFSTHHPAQSKLSALLHIYREKADKYHQQQEEQHHKNLEHRQSIIEKLKNLYTNTEAGTNLFKAIRDIKDEWKNAGQVAKSEFKLLNNNYFHHLNQFYQMLDMNKEYMEQEYAHNLEKREHIIQRAQELQTETVVQKALNELQYLHKLWKEEAEPVAEEFREKTWEMFKEISNKIHDRKGELTEQIEKEQQENLVKKNAIIEELNKLAVSGKESNHNYWQTAIKKVETLRTEFLQLGNVPRKASNQNWNDFKQNLRNFNISKNEFYKGLKHAQQSNLDEKLKLIQTAKDNMNSEDWETAVPLYKKLQEDWKKIGHVPRSMTNKVWDEFRESCNVFFNNYREKNNTANDNWKENFKNKKRLLDELKEIGSDEGSVEKIEQIKSTWNNIGKVPRDKIGINTEFNKVLREKLKLNKIHDYDLREEGLTENQLTDKARKIKNQIADMEAEVVKMENNLGFFSNSSRENPLLKDTYEKIDDKKSQIEAMKLSLHNIVAGENL